MISRRRILTAVSRRFIRCASDTVQYRSYTLTLDERGCQSLANLCGAGAHTRKYTDDQGTHQGYACPHRLPERPLRVFMVAGEHSGDEIGSALMGSLKELCPHGVHFSGIGGPLMQAAGLATSLVPLHSLAVMGFVEVLPRLWHIHHALRLAVDAATTPPLPDAVVTIDYKGFNFRLLRQIRNHSASAGQRPPAMIHYVAPSVWAFRRSDSRIRSLASLLDAMLCILPFEPVLWRNGGVPAYYVGHPVLETLGLEDEPFTPPESRLMSGEGPVICLLPGSRKQEMEQHLPLFERTMKILAGRWPRLSCVLPTVPDLVEDVRRKVSVWDVRSTVINSSLKEQCFADSTVALACSGSITAHLAAARLPSVVTYRANWITEWILKQRVTVKFASLPNIVLDREVIPEALFGSASPENLAELLHQLIEERSRRERQVQGMDEFIDRLRSSQPELIQTRDRRPSQVAALAVIKCISERFEESLGTSRAKCC